jgi:hypothetical protein
MLDVYAPVSIFTSISLSSSLGKSALSVRPMMILFVVIGMCFNVAYKVQRFVQAVCL